MRFLLMADTPADPDSGAAGTDIRTAQALRELGHEVDEIWSDRLGRRIGHGNLHYLLELPFSYRREMRRALKKAQYDVIYVSQQHAWLAAKTLHESGSPALFLHRSHGFEPHAQRVVNAWERRLGIPKPSMPKRFARRTMSRLLDRHSKLIAKHADGHVVLSTLDAHFMEHMGIDPARIAVIPPVIADPFRASEAPPMSAERLRRILYISQFAFFKAPGLVADSIATLARADASLQFTWVCSRAHHDDVRALLGEQANRVELLDWMPTEKLVEVYDRHGVFLFLSFYEGFGKVVLEAMCRGLCVFATRIGGAADIIDDGGTGMLFHPGDALSVVDAVQALIADPARAAAMSSAAAVAGRAYTWERVAHDVIAFCDRLRAMR